MTFPASVHLPIVLMFLSFIALSFLLILSLFFIFLFLSWHTLHLNLYGNLTVVYHSIVLNNLVLEHLLKARILIFI